MFERQFGLRENPFAAGHQSKYVYPSREHQEALAHLRFGIENREPFVLITGEVGTGKTTALYDALSEWKSRAVVALITNSALTRSELYEEICLRFGVPLAPPISKPMLMGHLERHLLGVRARGDFAILLIDEAQNLDRDLLEEVRLLSNLEAQGEKLLQIFLVGQPELEVKLAQTELRQLRQRIAVHYRLRPLAQEDTERYIHHRISVAGGHALTVFPSDACAEVQRVTHGIPREINTVAAQALLNAFVEDSASVRPEHVRAVERETEFRSVLDRESAERAPGIAATPVASVAAAPAPMPAAIAPATPPMEGSAVNREVRHVPEAAPSSPDSSGGHVEGPPSPGTPVRPAGTAETWQSWMASLAKMPTPPAEEAVNETASFEELQWTETPGTARESALPPVEPVLDAMAPTAAEIEEMIGREEPPVEEFAPIPFGEDLTQKHDYMDDLQTARVAPPPEPVWLEQAFSTAPPARTDAPEPAAKEEPLFMDEQVEAPPMRARPPIEAAPPRAPEPVEAAPRISHAPAQPIAAAPILSPRLRERLEAAERMESAQGNRSVGWLIGLAAVAAIVIAVVLVIRFRTPATHAKAPAAPVASAPTTPSPATSNAEPVGSTPNPNSPVPSQTSPAPTGGEAATTAKPTPAPVAATTKPATATPAAAAPAAGATTKPATPGTGTASAPAAAAGTAAAVGTAAATKPAVTAPAKPAAAPGVAKTLYGVEVASYLDEDRANTEKTRLMASTQLPGRVVATKEGDFLVVLGAFADRANAERSAGDLITKGLVDEARVKSFPNPAAKP